MGQKCIFCGKDIKEKTREHVIPKWLIELTGDKKRQANFGLDYGQINVSDSPSYHQFAFDQFTFPACKKCNNYYGDFLEANAKKIVIKILDENELSKQEITILLDWFDKIRIGLWLGGIALNKNITGIDPHFYINQRLGAKDRVLLIYKAQNVPNGINFSNIYNPFFNVNPCSLVLRINNYLFVNISIDNLLLRDFGFPYPQKITISEGMKLGYSELSKGSESIRGAVLEDLSIFKTSKTIYQPLYKNLINLCTINNEYVSSNSISQKDGIGEIYVLQNNAINIMCDNDKYCLKPREEYSNFINLYKKLLLYELENLEVLYKKILNYEFSTQEFENEVIKYSNYLTGINEALKISTRKLGLDQ